jgi:hypothetical protein
MRRAARVDQNQAEIVAALRAAGAYVWIIGLPVDILIGYKGRTVLAEIKRDSKARKTALQEDFFASWTGGTLVRIDRVEAALRVLRMIDGTV